MTLVKSVLFTIFFLFSISARGATEIDPRYHTYEEVVAELDSISQIYPEITRLDSIGVSTVDSLTIWALKISDNPEIEEDEPAVLYNACHHARELLGVEICMYMIDHLVSNYSIDSAVTRWIDSLEIWFVPIVNPEGHGVVWEGIEWWRKNKRDNDGNGTFNADSDGVDLNRNYDFNWEGSESDSIFSEYYKGTAPFSELETQVMRDLCLDQKFLFTINYHSPYYNPELAEQVFYPWIWNGLPAPDLPTIRAIADSVASLIVNDAGDGTYARVITKDPVGMARNWMYGIAGILALTIEVCDTCYMPGGMVDDICDRNSVGAYFLLDRVYGSGVTGHITDAMSREPLQAEVKILECDTIPVPISLPPRKSDPVYGRYWRVLKPRTYTVEVYKEGYANVTISDVVCSSDGPTLLDVELTPTEIAERIVSNPRNSHFLSARPNPFKESTTIGYFLGSPTITSLTIYSATGRVVKHLIDDRSQGPGYHMIRWDGKNTEGTPVPSGVYFYRLNVDSTYTEKLILLR